MILKLTSGLFPFVHLWLLVVELNPLRCSLCLPSCSCYVLLWLHDFWPLWIQWTHCSSSYYISSPESQPAPHQLFFWFLKHQSPATKLSKPPGLFPVLKVTWRLPNHYSIYCSCDWLFDKAQFDVHGGISIIQESTHGYDVTLILLLANSVPMSQTPCLMGMMGIFFTCAV